MRLFGIHFSEKRGGHVLCISASLSNCKVKEILIKFSTSVHRITMEVRLIYYIIFLNVFNLACLRSFSGLLKSI